MEQTIEKLLHQEFDSKLKGYDKDQVDNFLDEVIEDIEKLQTKHNLLLDEKKILEKNNFELKMKMLEMKEKMGSDVSSNTTHLGETKLVTPKQVAAIQSGESTMRVSTPTPQPQQEATATAEPVTHEDSRANDHTLQDRIEQLEKELNNIKSFSE